MSALIPALIDLLFPGVFPLGRGRGRGGGGGGGGGRAPQDPRAAAEKAAERSLIGIIDNKVPNPPHVQADDPVSRALEYLNRVTREGQ